MYKRKVNNLIQIKHEIIHVFIKRSFVREINAHGVVHAVKRELCSVNHRDLIPGRAIDKEYYVKIIEIHLGFGGATEVIDFRFIVPFEVGKRITYIYSINGIDVIMHSAYVKFTYHLKLGCYSFIGAYDHARTIPALKV